MDAALGQFLTILAAVAVCGGLGVAQPVKHESPIAMLEAFTIP
ncbi:hypothetical protein [Thermosynechococcus sp. HN-54]|nr:hypothetical protein [Thermosynechococcus sp. HN-54]